MTISIIIICACAPAGLPYMSAPAKRVLGPTGT